MSAVKKKKKNNKMLKIQLKKLQRFPSEKLDKSGGTRTVYVTHILLNSVGF
jgi:hypothetical protein